MKNVKRFQQPDDSQVFTNRGGNGAYRLPDPTEVNPHASAKQKAKNRKLNKLAYKARGK